VNDRKRCHFMPVPGPERRSTARDNIPQWFRPAGAAAAPRPWRLEVEVGRARSGGAVPAPRPRNIRSVAQSLRLLSRTTACALTASQVWGCGMWVSMSRSPPPPVAPLPATGATRSPQLRECAPRARPPACMHAGGLPRPGT
jgi:hypothetical protein